MNAAAKCDLAWTIDASARSDRDRAALDVADPLGSFGDEVFDVATACEIVDRVAALEDDAEGDDAPVQGQCGGSDEAFQVAGHGQ